MSSLSLLKNALNQVKNEKKALLTAAASSEPQQENTDHANNNNNSASSSSKRWVKKSEIEELRYKKVLEESKKGVKRKQEVSINSENNRDGESTSLDPNQKKTKIDNDDDDDNLETIPRIEVFRLLRSYGEPITLFGETDKLRLKRLKNIQTTLGEFKGQQNDFAKALKEREQEVADEVNTSGIEHSSNAESSTRQDGTKKEKIKYKGVHHKKESEDAYEFVLRVLKRLMKEWQYSLDELPEHVKKSSQGKHDATIFKQTKTYIKPLFKLLKKKQLSDEILKFLEPICTFMADREYVKANDVYMELAIGDQPWPIGVTMVGIHARTARERIGSDKIKHILNDEEQRRYVQSVKRLLTLAQKLYPTVPSKMVE
ncbi:hypothetical protein C9374_003343 [Naegleria lovaniensis]|uniref:Pre-mRNA-splicing factor 18 n=1 Tax=Naegleria lovaniensis TaxID=51637 RepID=A0AA88GT27_NAELO|nr:uncharacterized protein C9374_003343 [Naegleria lovaniensis]KAG2385528.1 hypothetical protein C9374_003343 [Naegleria lovaniensis]